MNRTHLHAVPSAGAFVPVSDPPAHQQDTIGLMRDTERTKAIAVQAGAEGVEMTVADINGVEIQPDVIDTGLPDQVRVQAIAVFPNGITIVGQSDPIERAHYVMHSNNLECRQALGDLRAKLSQPPRRTFPTVPS